MKLTVEISMYPFNEDYVPPIHGIIERFNSYADIKVKTVPTSTLLTGEYDRLMAVLTKEIKHCFDTYGKAVYVAKFLPGMEAPL
ncbi:hypothetical protein QSV34_13795 [Porticoccus sp. W117]|uniref:hypothetical protein n=1 Tax=Porticoccus sp. W117 TaxID=3054777 RepID=UPI002591B342|nr:hypothetical protein [Porticoccus sp. W117]MDM3872420.1 hypothetical protein [Porticoccus sp. W117]